MQHLILILGIAFVSIAFFFLMLYGQLNFLDAQVVPGAGIKIKDWLGLFFELSLIGIVVSGVTALIWYLLGAFVFKVNNWTDSQKQAVWLLLFIIPIGTGIVSCYLTEPTQYGVSYAYTFYFVNNILIYYLGTALFSPPSFKYVPFGSTIFRRW